MLSFSHSGNIGDVACSIPSVIDICRRKNTKANFYLKVGTQASYMAGLEHPLGNVTLNKSFAEKLIPLLESQHWCNSCRIWSGEEIEYDLDLFRVLFKPNTSLVRQYFWLYHSTYNLSQPWLWVEPNKAYANRIVVNRTFRYRQPLCDYSNLNGYPVTFIGLEKEYKDFQRHCECEFVEAKDFLELAQIIAGCRLFLGNQSFAYNIAEALKVKPRVLEVCTMALNVVPIGDQAYDFINRLGYKDIMDELLLTISKVVI